MISDDRVDRIEVKFQLAALVQFGEVPASFKRIFRDELRVVTVLQIQVLVLQAYCGSRLGRHNLKSLAYRFGEHSHIAAGEMASDM